MCMTTFLHSVRKFILCLAIVALPLAAQTGTSVIRGTVLDATKAAIPSAKITLTNTATGVVRTVDSSAVGIYYFGSVSPGPYSIAVESSGFKKWTGTLTLEVGQTAVVDPSLEVGSLEATVEVTGAAPTITTQGMEVSDVKDALRIQQLPLNGRVITNLFNLTPGRMGKLRQDLVRYVDLGDCPVKIAKDDRCGLGVFACHQFRHPEKS